MKIEVVDYNPVWRQQFEQVHSLLSDLIGEDCVAIEHVGSTSVEGLAAKPKIDIDIVVESKAQSQKCIEILCQNEYRHRGNLGIADREVLQALNPPFAYNLYVCLQKSSALKNHLTLRNHLRKNLDDRDEYSKLKKELAKKFPDNIDSYVSGKTNFIVSILSKYDFSIEVLESIVRANSNTR